MAKKRPPEHVRVNRANQLNPTHPAYHRSRGASPEAAEQAASHAKATLDNRANQLNPNSDAFQRSRRSKLSQREPRK